MIPYGKQDINQEDIDAVVEVLKSEFITQGPKVPEFEKTLAEYAGSGYALALNSATSALHVACLALGLGDGDILWTTPITFVASANCALYCGAEIDFVDIDTQTYNLCPAALKEKLIIAKAEGRLPKIVVPVHLCGQSCDMESINLLAQEYGFSVIEDASHAIGGRYKGYPVGSCRYSDITIFSFHPVKIVTTAEGGAALTNDCDLMKRMELFRSHGITRDEALMVGESHGPWYYQQTTLGFNYRMTELQAALGLSQMSRLDKFVEARHCLASKYDELLADFPVIIPHQLPDSYSGLHLYVIRLNLDEIRCSHKDVFCKLRASGVGVNLHYIPVHIQPYYRELGFCENDFPVSMHYYKEAISLPMYPNLTQEQLVEIVDKLREIIC